MTENGHNTTGNGRHTIENGRRATGHDCRKADGVRRTSGVSRRNTGRDCRKPDSDRRAGVVGRRTVGDVWWRLGGLRRGTPVVTGVGRRALDLMSVKPLGQRYSELEDRPPHFQGLGSGVA